MVPNKIQFTAWERIQSAANMDISQHEACFTQYAKTKIAGAKTDPAPLELKTLHTRNVLANARKIASSENFPPHLQRACQLAALYHDIARFDQYLIYNTFKDKDSRNHGQWGTKILRKTGLLSEESEEIQTLVLLAIRMHNRRSLPQNLSDDIRIVCQTTRDADKIDIARVMDEHLSGPGPYNPTVILGLPDAPDKFSQKVLDCALASRTAFYDDLCSVNDFRILLATWHFDLGFESSKALFRQNGHAANLLSKVPDHGAYAAAKQYLQRTLNQN